MGMPAARKPLDPFALRPRFPGLALEVNGRPAAFLDGPAGAQVPLEVIDAMAAYLRRSNANTGGAFPTSERTDALVAQAREAAADLLGADAEGVAFGPNATTLNYLLAHAVARTLEPGDEIVTTDLDHDANVAPWERVALDRGLVVKHAPIDAERGTLEPDAVERCFTRRTRLVAFTLASNALGTI